MSKVALVPGGSHGIGRAISVALAGAGYSVIINYSSRAAAEGHRGRHPGARRHRACPSDRRERRLGRGAHVRGCRLALRGLDALVNNAGLGQRIVNLVGGEDGSDGLERLPAPG